jgi:hypothetical protein
VSGQGSCTFVGGFATLREQVGAQKVGECLEDEHVSAETGDSEQRTTGGLLVWRKADNFTAFTDGGTTWVNGPNGLQSRPNGERFSWETEPVAVAPSSSSGPMATPTPLANVSPVVLASSPGPLSAGPLSAAGPGALAAADSLPQAPVAAAPPATATATATAVKPTRTPTPTPAVRAKLTEKPDNVDTGSDARFEVETNAKKGTCTLVVGYRNTKDATVSSVEIDDGRCDMKYTIPEDTRTGKAKAKVTVSSSQGTATIDDEFDVNEGEMVLAGDIDIRLEGVDLPDDVDVGDQFKVTVDSNLNNRGKCEMSVAWPKHAATAGEAKTPDGRGRCSWTVTVPTEIPKRGKATLTVVVRKNNKKNSTELRVLTREFDVRK